MTLPEWLESNVRQRIQPNEKVVEFSVLKETAFKKVAVVATNERSIVVTKGLFGADAFVLPGFVGDGASQLVHQPIRDTRTPGTQAGPDVPAAGSRVATPATTAVTPGADLTAIDGIGPARAKTLGGLGVEDLDDLVRAEPAKLAKALGRGVDVERVKTWQNDAAQFVGEAATASAEDLTLVKGIGSVRAGQLVSNGVGTVQALVDADAEALAATLDVSVKRVQGWQAAAREL